MGVAAAINILGDVALDQGELQEAQHLFSESLAQRRISGEKYGLIDDLRGLSQVCWQLEDYSRARVNLEEALAYARDLGVPRLIAATLRDLASRDLQLGDQQHGLEKVRESLNLSRQQDDPIGVAESLEVLADAAVEAGQFEFALRLVAGAAGLRETAGLRRTPRQEPEAARRLAKIHAHLEKALFDRLWDEFRRLPLDQVIEVVLESQDHQS